MAVHVRIAPSPTGLFHIGTARTALFNYVFAKNHNGHFLLRIDDTDASRSEKRFEEDIIQGLSWLGILWDSFFRQSEHGALYRGHLEKLYEEKKIFRCPHTIDELSKERNDHMQKKEAPRHICSYREKNHSQGILRFKNTSTDPIVFHDLIRGDISFNPKILGDFSIAKNLDSPLYNFTTVVDDENEKITHIIRGEDHIPNTPKQILLARAMNFNTMSYAHLPLILGKDRSKLSKRHGPTAILEYKKEGYLPETIINFLGLLGWHPLESHGTDEIFTMEDIIKQFSFERVQKAGALFDEEKLKWLNGVYIRKMAPEILARKLLEYLQPEWRKKAEGNDEWWEKVAILEQPRLLYLSEIGERADYFFENPSLRKDLLIDTLPDTSRIITHLRSIQNIIASINEKKFNKEIMENSIMPYAVQNSKKEVLWPFRVALTGKRASSGLFEVAELLGKETVQKRLMHAIKLLEP